MTSDVPSPTPAPAIGASNPAPGLTNDEAARRLNEVGRNVVANVAQHPLRRAIEKFWAPVPWMLEAAIVLELSLGKDVEAAIIGGLLAFNAALGLLQESRAQATLDALMSKLALNASVRRDGAWKVVLAADIAPGDVVKLSLGAVVPADASVIDGQVLLDQSMLTGESMPVEAGPGVMAYAGALVRRGEALAEIVATGSRTKFGRTAELVQTAHVVSSQQKAVLRVVGGLSVFNGAIIGIVLVYAYFLGLGSAQVVPLVLTGVLGSIPVALPATFTLAAAIGAQALAKVGVLPTRLSAVDEAASMDVLCADKTGTLTRNALKVATVQPMPEFDVARVLALAALASSDGGQDPVDAAIRSAAAVNGGVARGQLIKFTPFDPTKKMSEALALSPGEGEQRILKGAFAVIYPLTPPSPSAASASEALEKQGYRVLAVAAGSPTSVKLVGLIALSDPPRSDSATLIAELKDLGIRTVMVTGDARGTAAIVAHAVGLDGAPYPPGPISETIDPEAFRVYAGVLPEDKYKLVKAFQASGHVVGMCGDGVNDAPALRQAQMGIAVSTATDVAKAAAGVVLIDPGLAGIVAAVREGRVTFQRIQTYTLNSIVKKVIAVLYLFVGLMLTGQAILTPLLMAIIMIAGDFLAMSLTTDNVSPSARPNRWRIGGLTIAGVVMGAGLLAFCGGVIAVGRFAMALEIDEMRTLAFIALVFGSQATIYAIRGRRSLWGRRPSFWLLASSAADILIAATLALRGIAMAPLSPMVVGGALAAATAFSIVLAGVKLPVFARLEIA